jgi:hypothetical protein
MGHTRKGLLRRLRKAPVPVKAPSGLPVPPIVLWGAMFALLLALAAGSALRRRRAAERSTTDAGAPD